MIHNNHMSKTYDVFQNWLRDESGATAIEYGLMAALIALSIITGASAFSTGLNAKFDEASTVLNGT